MRVWGWLIGFLVLGQAVQAVGAESVRFAVIVGNNLGRNPDRRLRFAEDDARKLRQVLLERSGFSEQNTRLVLGKTAAEAWIALTEIERELARRARETGRKTLLVVYYSGHADGDELELGPTSLEFGKLRQFLKHSAATVRLAIVDACQSGKLVTTKGARPAPGYRIQITDELTSSGFAIITSSTEDELSQESQEIRGSFFTHFFVSALRGAADQSRDGRITLNEAYQYAYTRTVARTSSSLGGAQHPMYRLRMAGHGEVVLASSPGVRSRVAVRVSRNGRLVLMDSQRRQMLAEAQTQRGHEVVLGVPPGRYVLYHLGDEGLRVAQVRVGRTGVTRVDASMFARESLAQSVPKGGLFRPTWEHRIDAGFLLRRWPLDGQALSYGAAVQYRLQHPTGWAPSARLTVSAAPDTETSSGYLDFDLTAGGGFRFGSLWRFVPRLEALVGYGHMRQSARDGQSRHTSAFAYLGQAAIDLPLWPVVVSVAAGAGGRVFQLSSEGWVHRLDLQLVTAVGLQWE